MPTTRRQLYDFLKSTLDGAGIDLADLTARRILADFAGISLTELMTDSGVEVSQETEGTCRGALTRHLAGEPLSRIMGIREFYGLPFALSPATLDPRPDTETVVEAVRDWIRETERGGTPLRLLDLGTGTGCIAIALLTLFPNLTAVAVDLAPDAIRQARDNAERNGVADRFWPLCGRWADALSGRFDLIVSNPPYIPARDIPNLEESVRTYDPILALDGGEDGFDAHRALMDVIKMQLDPAGAAFIEIGIGQLPALRRLVQTSGVVLSRTVMDKGGIPRVVRITKEEN